MDYNKKTDIINSLAAHMGVFDSHNSKYTGSRYDASTGTLYCEGITLANSSLDRIKTWYQSQMLSYREMASRDPELKEMYMRFAVGYNAILMLEERVKSTE